MKYSKIINTDLTASKIVLGTDRFGTAISEKDSFEIMNKFIEFGGNMIDTASFYANWLNMGDSVSEKTIGKWLEKYKCRKEIIISTKGGHPRFETMDVSRMSEKEMREDFEKSLFNLRTDYIDIYWFHKDDIRIPPEELIEVLNAVTENGRAKYLGVANWTYDRIRAANEYAKKKNLRPIIASQVQYSIAKVNYERSDLHVMTESEYEKYSNDNINVFGFSTQAKGFFAILDSLGEKGLPNDVKKEFYNEYNLRLFKRIKQIAEAKNTTVPAITLAALINDKRVNTFAQIGPQNSRELLSSLASTEINLTIEYKEN